MYNVSPRPSVFIGHLITALYSFPLVYQWLHFRDGGVLCLASKLQFGRADSRLPSVEMPQFQDALLCS